MLLPRVLTALFLVLVVYLSLFYLVPPAFAWAALALPVLGSWEWGRLFQFDQAQKLLFSSAMLVVALAFLLVPESFMLVPILLGLATIFWLSLVPLWLYWKWKLTHKGVAAALGLILLLSAWLSMILWRQGAPMFPGIAHEASPWNLLSLMVVVWIADTAAYFTGRAIGRHKLAPNISPGKTWEGAAGALLAVTVYLFVLYGMPRLSTDPMMALRLLVVALVLTGVSIMGDLLESLFKRQAGLKDSGNCLPGHGGILDRVDSLIAVLAVSGLPQLLLLYSHVQSGG